MSVLRHCTFAQVSRPGVPACILVGYAHITAVILTGVTKCESERQDLGHHNPTDSLLYSSAM